MPPGIGGFGLDVLTKPDRAVIGRLVFFVFFSSYLPNQ